MFLKRSVFQIDPDQLNTIAAEVYQGGDTMGAGKPWTPLFFVAKIKKGNKGKKERLLKQKLLKGCRQNQNVIVLTILERLEFKKSFFSANKGGRQWSVVPPLGNPYRRPWYLGS